MKDKELREALSMSGILRGAYEHPYPTDLLDKIHASLSYLLRRMESLEKELGYTYINDKTILQASHHEKHDSKRP